MHQSSKDFYREVLEFSLRLQQEIPDLLEAVEQEKTLIELADTAYAIRRSFEVLEDALKHLRSLKTASEKVLCLRWALQAEPTAIRTEYTTASPECTDMPQIPSRKTAPEQYKRLLVELGCKPEMAEDDTVRPHWPGLAEYFRKLNAEGRPLPAGVDPSKTYPVFSCRFLKKKGIIEDDDN